MTAMATAHRSAAAAAASASLPQCGSGSSLSRSLGGQIRHHEHVSRAVSVDSSSRSGGDHCGSGGDHGRSGFPQRIWRGPWQILGLWWRRRRWWWWRRRLAPRPLHSMMAAVKKAGTEGEVTAGAEGEAS